MAFLALSHLVCSRSGKRYDAAVVQGVSHAGAPLLAHDDLDGVKASVRREDIATRRPTLWRYHEVLPVRDESFVVTMGEGMSPLTPLPAYGTEIG